jgi:hypothetical protein
LSNNHDPIEPQSHSNWGLIANPLLPLKSLIADYQRVTNLLIFAIFTAIGNFVCVEANFNVNFLTSKCPFCNMDFLFGHNKKEGCIKD